MELPLTGTNFHAPKPIRATEDLLYTLKVKSCCMDKCAGNKFETGSLVELYCDFVYISEGGLASWKTDSLFELLANEIFRISQRSMSVECLFTE